MDGALNALAFATTRLALSNAIGGAFDTWNPVDTKTKRRAFNLFEIARAFTHGVVQGKLAEEFGGEFRSGSAGGFAASVFGSLQGAGFGRKYFGNPNDPEDRGKLPLRTVAAAIVGGTVSALSGGKFANGAATGAMVHVFNAEKPKEGNGDENEFIIIGDPDSTHVVMKLGPDGLLKVMGINNVEVEIKKIKTKVNIEVKRLEFAGSLDSGAQKWGYDFLRKSLI